MIVCEICYDGLCIISDTAGGESRHCTLEHLDQSVLMWFEYFVGNFVIGVGKPKDGLYKNFICQSYNLIRGNIL